MVRSDAILTDYANCTHDVKQGDVCSPVLFSLIMNELTLEETENWSHGAAIIPDVIELSILLSADGVVLLSETPAGLQAQHWATCTYHLNVRMKKT